MKCTVDTNVLLRVFIGDDPAQQRIALASLSQAELTAIPTQALCEFVWVSTRRYKKGRSEVAAAIRAMLDMPMAVTDRAAVAAGLRQFEAGGDFADGVIIHDGRKLGGATFLTFDRAAANLLVSFGEPSRLLAVAQDRV